MVSDIIIALDDRPAEAYRQFFESCSDEIRQKATDNSITHHRISHNNLNHEYVNSVVEGINDTFVFSAFSHGKRNALVCDENEYVSTTQNNYIFSGSLFYTFACHCGTDLKDELVRNGVDCFWGYNSEVNFCPDIPQFLDCATLGLKCLLDGNSLSVAKQTLMQKYDASIAELYKSSNGFVQVALMDANRESLVIVGEDDYIL